MDDMYAVIASLSDERANSPSCTVSASAEVLSATSYVNFATLLLAYLCFPECNGIIKPSFSGGSCAKPEAVTKPVIDMKLCGNTDG